MDDPGGLADGMPAWVFSFSTGIVCVWSGGLKCSHDIGRLSGLVRCCGVMACSCTWLGAREFDGKPSDIIAGWE